MAEEARRIGIVLNSVVGSSAADRESSADRHEERSHQSSLSAANSIGTSDGRPRSVSGDNKGGRRRRPKPASHNCIPTNPQRGSTVRQQPASNVRQNIAAALFLFFRRFCWERRRSFWRDWGRSEEFRFFTEVAGNVCVECLCGTWTRVNQHPQEVCRNVEETSPCNRNVPILPLFG